MNLYYFYFLFLLLFLKVRSEGQKKKREIYITPYDKLICNKEIINEDE